jgi:perosamine synthetase
MQSEWLGMGRKTKQFENELCSLVGAQNSVAVNNGMSSLITSLLANGIRPGNEVILPINFIATVESVLAIGAGPILVDCNPLTNASSNLISRTISEHPTAKLVIFIDFAGKPSYIDKMRELLSKKDLVQ